MVDSVRPAETHPSSHTLAGRTDSHPANNTQPDKPSFPKKGDTINVRKAVYTGTYLSEAFYRGEYPVGNIVYAVSIATDLSNGVIPQQTLFDCAVGITEIYRFAISGYLVSDENTQTGNAEPQGEYRVGNRVRVATLQSESLINNTLPRYLAVVEDGSTTLNLHILDVENKIRLDIDGNLESPTPLDVIINRIRGDMREGDRRILDVSAVPPRT